MPLPRSITVAAALGAVAFALYAGSMLVDVGDEYDEMAQDAYLGVDGDEVDARAEAEDKRERLAMAARGVSRASAERRAADPLLADNEVEAPALDLTQPLTAEDAQAGFDYAMRRVERIAKTRRRLKAEQWQELYREANDAFSAYSMQLDAGDVNQLAQLEDAHVRLKKGLRRVRVRGKKFAE